MTKHHIGAGVFAALCVAAATGTFGACSTKPEPAAPATAPSARIEPEGVSAENAIPLFLEPRLKIVELKIERDILVTTNLKLSLEAYNPNAFPVEISSFGYTFDGEGKPWADGETPGPFTIPPQSSGRVELAFEMNFADRERELLDLVNKLEVVRYRLAGRASVKADPGFPLVFPLEFDESGSCRVER